MSKATAIAPNDRPPRLRAILKSLIATIGLVWFVLTVVFLIFTVLPADPVRSALGINASEDAVESLRHELGYDRPIYEQYARFLMDTVKLRLECSIHFQTPVTLMILEGFKITATNGFCAMCFSVVVSFIITLGSWHSKRFERFVLVVCWLLTSIPSLVLSVAVGVIAYSILGGFTSWGPREMVGIIIALSIYPTCSLTEIAILETRRVRSRTYVTAARSMGMSESFIFARCILPSTFTGWAGQISNLAASIFVSSAIIDAVFSLPGVGYLLLTSMIHNDLPVIRALMLVVILAFLAIDSVFDHLWLSRRAVHRVRSDS